MMLAFSKSALLSLFFSVLPALGSLAIGQEFAVQKLAEALPGDVPQGLKSSLASDGYRILDTEGQPLLDLWLRQTIPAKFKPGAPQNGALFPFLEEGEWLGVVRYHKEGGDYRDQAIPPGIYELRYLVHPINGDHQGVSPFRDYGLLTQIAKDGKATVLKRDLLEKASAEVAGSNHPTVLMLAAPPAGSKAPAIIRDQEKETWGVQLQVKLAVSGESESSDFNFVLIVEGAAPL